MNALSLFTGAGGFDLGLERAGITTVAMCEIDPHARSVLAHHWPDTPIHDDVTTLNPESITDGAIDLVHGGSPRQDLSVAGRRGGLGGERSGLFWHQCRIADHVAAPWVLWENVAGALSSNSGADFAAVLYGITGTLPDVPDGGWRGGGVVVGPKRTAAWRLVDARYFGVAQRRRRVFVVGHPDPRRAIPVLLEPDGLRGGAPQSRGEGQGGAVGALLSPDGRGWRVGADEAAAGHLIPDRTGTVTANWGKGAGNTQVDEGILVPVAFAENQRGELRVSDYVPSLSTGGGKPGSGYPAIAFGWSNAATQGDDVTVDGTGPPRTKEQPAVTSPQGVRRLTPLECERLMGWPDNWTAQGVDGPLADTNRYRLIGNGVVAPVAEWIGRRIIHCTCGGELDTTVHHNDTPDGHPLCEHCCTTCQESP